VNIWIDGDACPVAIKEILFRAAQRLGIPLILVANRLLRVPPSPHIRAVQVPGGFDVADKYIAQAVQAEDLVITADIPLAAAVIDKGGFALDVRGEFYSADNVRERLNMRDFMEGLRAAGVATGGPAALSHADRQAFANQLDRFLVVRLGSR
jgi:hypothetical protein